ncbi:hypothetical protein ACHAWC_001032, partial [Mediolabrus comicus]
MNNGNHLRVVSRESSAASDIIDLVQNDGSNVDEEEGKKSSNIDPFNQNSVDNGMQFRGGRQSSTQSFSESDVIDLISSDSGGQVAKMRHAPTSLNHENESYERTSSANRTSSAKRRRLSYDDPTEPKDHAVITHGIIDLLGQLHSESSLSVNTLTCAGYSECAALSSSFPQYNHKPLHYQQNDNWSCGYRNLQMMISSMLPTLRSVFPDGVPSIYEIQSTMQQLWKAGFDQSSADHYNHSLLGKTGKNAMIGTLEAWSYLSYLGVDAAIIQFVKEEENRAMIGDFVWQYFSKMVGPDGCSCYDDVTIVQPGSLPIANPSLSSFEYGCKLFNTRVNDDDFIPRSSCTCVLPSLYLQWEGHSITVVGIRKVKSTDGSPPTFNLIVFDPHMRGAYAKAKFATGVEEHRSLESVLTKIKRIELPVNEL